MLQKFEVQGVHMTLDDSLRRYVNKKIGGLDHYVSRHNRQSAHAEVYLKKAKAKDNSQCTCEVTLYLPHETINLQESAFNMYAAVDIVEAKLKQQLKKYKDLHQNGRMRQRLMARLGRRQLADTGQVQPEV
jgi:ribosomal subunit interface protein